MERVGFRRGSGASAGTAQRDRERVRHFSSPSYLLFTAWGLALSLIVDGWQLAGLVLLELAFGLVWQREGLRPLRRPRFWAFVLIAVALGPFLHYRTASALQLSWAEVTSGLSTGRSVLCGVGTGRSVLCGVGTGRSVLCGVGTGLEMAGRAFGITMAFSLGMSSLSLSDLIAMFDRVGLRGLGFALGLAMNLLSSLREMAMVTLQTIRLRGGMRRPLVGLRLFLITLVSNTLRYGDQVIDAAAVRAFDPGSERGATSLYECSGRAWRRPDTWLLVALMGFGAAFWALGGW